MKKKPVYNKNMKNDLLKPIHPGEILLEEFLKPLSISPSQLAMDIEIPVDQVDEIVNGTCNLTSELAARLSTYFGMSERFWMNVQNHYELDLQR